MQSEWWFLGVVAFFLICLYMRNSIQFTTWFNFLIMKNDFEKHFLRTPTRSERRLLWSFGKLANTVLRLKRHPKEGLHRYRLGSALDQCRYQLNSYSIYDDMRSDEILNWLNDKYRVAASYLTNQHHPETPIDRVIAQSIWLIDYRDHYLEVFDHDASRLTDKVLAELFVFRAWTTRFALCFASPTANHETLISETINGSKYRGIKIFEETHGFSLEEELKRNFMDLIENRWYTYDDVVVLSSKEIPAIELCGELLRLANVADPIVLSNLAKDFLSQVDSLVKSTVRKNTDK